MYCSGDVFIFLFKEHFLGSLCYKGPSGAPGDMILSEEKRGKFAVDQTQRHREGQRELRVTDETVPGPAQICVFCQHLRAPNNVEFTHSSGRVAAVGMGC